MYKNLPTKVWENGLSNNITTARELLQLTEGLTLTLILNEYEELERLKERYDLLKIMYRDAQRTIDRCVKEGKELKDKIDNYPQLSTLKNTEGAFMKVGRYIAEVVKQLNCNQSMNESQIDFAAHDILETYGEQLSLKELAWILRRGITGNYGKTDFKIDVQTFHTWIQKFLSDKNERISQRQEMKAREAEAISECRDIIQRNLNR